MRLHPAARTLDRGGESFPPSLVQNQSLALSSPLFEKRKSIEAFFSRRRRPRSRPSRVVVGGARALRTEEGPSQQQSLPPSLPPSEAPTDRPTE